MAEDTPFAGECCSDMVGMKTWRIDHEARHDKLDEILDRTVNRLPNWATLAFSLGGAVIGSLLTIIVILLSQLAH